MIGSILGKLTEEHRQKYDVYIREHMDNVRKVYACFKEKCPNASVNFVTLPYEMIPMDAYITIHDESKFEDYECEPYALWFTAGIRTEESKTLFDKAWLHHIHQNPHHPEHWLLVRDDMTVDILEMPEPFVLEFLCDITAMSVKFGGLPSEFLAKNPKPLHPVSKDRMESMLPIFDEIAKELQS